MSLSATITKTVNSAVISTVKGYITEFASRLSNELGAKENKKKEWKSDDIVALWNEIAKDFVLKKGGKEKSAPEDASQQCMHVFGKGDKRDTQCTDKISEKSETKKYCVRHYKQQEKDKSKNDGEKVEGECCYILTKGDNEGKECHAKVSSKSESGKYCSKHAGEDKKTKKVDKSECIKYITNQLKENDDVQSTFEKVLKKYGYMFVYNLEHFLPKTYSQHRPVIDEIIENGREEFESDIAEFEEKAAKELKKKEKKSKKDSKKSDTEEDDGEKEESKPVKSGSSKKEESKPVKSGSKKKEVEEKEEEDIEEEEVVEEEEEEVVEEEEKEEIKIKIKAKKYKTGELAGEAYFIDKDSKIEFLLNLDDKSVSHKVVDGKKVSLTASDKKIVLSSGLSVSK